MISSMVSGSGALYTFAGTIILGLIYSTAIILYNLFFHPLAKYPGPKVRAALDFPYFWSLIRGYAPQYMLELHNTYGPVVRVAPNELIFNRPQAFKDIYGLKRPGQEELKKDKKYVEGMGEPTLLFSDQTYHSYLRKLMAPGFSEGGLRKQEAVILGHVNVLTNKLSEVGQRGQTSVDLLKWVNFFVFDVVGHLTYGDQFDCLTTSNLHVWVTKFTKLGRPMAYAQASARLPKLLRLPFMVLALDRSLMSDRNFLYETSEAKVKSRVNKESPIPDFMGNLIQSHKDGKMTTFQLNSNAVFLMAAGTETLVTAIVHTVYRLLMNKETLHKLVQEIRGKFTTAENIHMTGVNGCKYLLACINESLRIQAPSPATHPRYTPAGGMTIDGHYVPGNVAVGVPIHAACRGDANFRDPEKYVPERWTGELPQYATDSKDAAMIFSVGPRDCLGRNIAMMGLKLVLAHLIWQFDLEQCFPDDWAEQEVYLVWEKPPIHVKLHPVDRS
ncbi:related to cytochrome P450 CYP3/CYP5/CYP6/CYP9 subfamilies [Ramularia collo-cygni]|uniref:Related to cytochrome P450 CYP3/CYP5/CYP6/CYP9 subfamilies n=1 Tax=Ramularia collo-cygni TaxID=112498 RepID=A0A2D3V7R3_9PEZI|nr:related to cytochrome P450 CYP3/CYP5/CYP6/CYP9 subfamilies [Ramularia collo-cygni]CZT16383.1 related to cytochrome P450 CYP3/CYP5/CYP6/CYP9 subfamilies [Ramularia collo-cygni]